MVISKVEKPLRVHFHRKYEIIFSAVSGLHVEFAADYMPTLLPINLPPCLRHSQDSRWQHCLHVRRHYLTRNVQLCVFVR